MQMQNYRLIGVLERPPSSCGESNSETVLDESFYAEDDEDAKKKACEIVEKRMRSFGNTSDGELRFRMEATRRVGEFHFVPSQPAEPAREAKPAIPARLE